MWYRPQFFEFFLENSKKFLQWRSIIFNNTNSSAATCGLRASTETPTSGGSIPHNFTLAANETLIIENYIGKATAASGVKIIELL